MLSLRKAYGDNKQPIDHLVKALFGLVPWLINSINPLTSDSSKNYEFLLKILRKNKNSLNQQNSIMRAMQYGNSPEIDIKELAA